MNKIIILFCFVVIIAFSLRVFNLGTVPFVSDEFLDVNATYGQYKTGQWQAWDFNHGESSIRKNKASDERAWVYRKQISVLYNYLPPIEKNIRIVSVIWGVLTVILLYGVTFIFTRNHWIAFFASFLFAVSVPAIEINRKIRMYSMFAPVFLAFSTSLYYFLEKGKSKSKKLIIQIFNFNYIFIIPTILLGILSYHLHPLTVNIAIIVFIFFIIRMIQEVKLLGLFNRYLIYNIFIIFTILIIVLFFVEKVNGTIEFLNNHWSYVEHILASYWHPLLGGFLLLMGMYATFKEKYFNNEYLWININFFAILFAGIFLWNRNVGQQYIFFAQSFGFIIVSIGIYFVMETLNREVTLNKKIFLYGILVVVIFLPNYSYFFEKDNTYHITSKGERANYRNLFLYVKENRARDDVMITRNFRNYYFDKFDMQVFDFGSERSNQELKKEGKVQKITEDYVINIVNNNPSGWVVYSDNDKKFITKEAQKYFEENMIEINDSILVRGKVKIYKWGE